ncbi:xanthine permease [Slackia equolifaciens]|uniref:xanthine permease n=1 Tax=Slackia equolifaciens TaxID=498718 RepID=UPI0015E88E3E|nr:xanthine permease [Slackia equolifaciens]
MAQSIEAKGKGTPLWVSSDINGFFGLFSNSLTNFLTAIGLLAGIAMPNDIVFGRIVPAAALSIAFGNFILGVIARRMSIREGRADVTAMPYGLSVPHYFAVALGVILPTYVVTQDWMVAWATGIVWNLIQGIIMLVGAFVGPWIKEHLPRAAMLGALAGFALTFISGVPIGEMYAAPMIGMVCFIILMVGWLSHKRLPLNMPVGAFAILVGTIIAWATGYMDPANVTAAASNFGIPIPELTVGLFAVGFAQIAPFLPAAIPLGIYDFLESLNNLESAAVAGEKYPVAQSMCVPAVLTILASCIGSVFPTIIYIGHPGWKAAGARIGYSFLTGAAILLLAFTGLLEIVSAVIPLAALLPILVYIGMVIGQQAFETAAPRHFPAVILAFMPYIGSFIVGKIGSVIDSVNAALAQAGSNISVAISEIPMDGVVTVSNAILSGNGVPYLGWDRLSGGDIIIAMLIASIVIYTIDRRYMRAAVYSLVGAVLSFFGIIHAASFGINAAPEVMIGYLGMAVVLVAMNYYRKADNVPIDDEEADEKAPDDSAEAPEKAEEATA